MHTAAQQLDGQISGVSGTIWDGLSVGDFSFSVPGVDMTLKQFHLQANWHELLNRRLHIRDLSAAAVSVALTATPDEAPSEAFSMPVLPLTVAIDRFAIDELALSQDGEPLPVSIQKLQTSLALSHDGGQLVIQSLKLGNEQINAGIEGELRVLALQAPWPLQAHLVTLASAVTPDSPLCASHYLPPVGRISAPAHNPRPDARPDQHRASTATLGTSPETESATPPAPVATRPHQAPSCDVALNTQITGNLDAFQLSVQGSGQGIDLSLDAALTPTGVFPLKTATLALQLPDGSSLNGNLDWASIQAGDAVLDSLAGSLRADKLNVGQLVGSAIPSAVITASADFDVQLRDHADLLSANVALNVASGSSWNKQALSGGLKGKVINTSADDAGANTTPLWQGLQLAALDMDLRLGKNRLQAEGALGAADTRLKLDMLAPDLDAFWPDLPGGANVKGDVAGSLAGHKADLTAQYTPAKSQPQEVGSAPVKVHVVLDGGWGKGSAGQDEAIGWRGKVSVLDVDHAGLGLRAGTATSVSFLPDAVAPAWQWQVGTTELALSMASRPLFVLAHQGSRGGAGRWETQGAIARLPISEQLIIDLRKKLDQSGVKKTDRGGVKVKANKGGALSEVVFGLNWNLRFAGTLEGEATIERLSGDIMVPAEPAFPLGLQTFKLNVNAKRSTASSSLLAANLELATAKMGRATVAATTLIHATAGGGLALEPKDIKTANIVADMSDLGWTSLFLDDAMELGGAVKANVQLKSRPDGTWDSSGAITGQKLRVVRIDDGVRLLNGTLSARLQNERLILDSLSFPASLRVEPKEWRTAEWLKTNDAAKGGKLTMTGSWNLLESSGVVDVDLYRYPILQRSDRYAMITGKLSLVPELPKITMNGAITVDAGWFDLDMLGGIPSVDSDVVVLRPGQKKQESSAPMDIAMDLDVDLGRRFYLTGYGVNSGLIGQMHVAMHNGKLTGVGALRTRGGAIETYGQRLQLRRGTVTFQGDITSPVLDIEALRTGLAVEAGVRVAGTAKRPRIDLVSYPAVSEIEKLSWLLLGHGADDSSGDMALLFSVGTSFLGGGEPFYRKFGIDEVSIKSGQLGSAGSILPAESVVSGLDSGTSDIERKFISVSKTLSGGITLSVQQALSDTGSVGRVGYRLARGLTAELSVGTINGLALVYRWFSRD